jgi:hypothetical protein
MSPVIHSGEKTRREATLQVPLNGIESQKLRLTPRTTVGWLASGLKT